jgi:hypothetical protein
MTSIFGTECAVAVDDIPWGSKSLGAGMTVEKRNPCCLKRVEKSSSPIEVDGPNARIADVDCRYELRKIVCVPDGWIVVHGYSNRGEVCPAKAGSGERIGEEKDAGARTHKP